MKTPKIVFARNGDVYLRDAKVGAYFETMGGHWRFKPSVPGLEECGARYLKTLREIVSKSMISAESSK